MEKNVAYNLAKQILFYLTKMLWIKGEKTKINSHYVIYILLQ